jgi:hypothetical protein
VIVLQNGSASDASTFYIAPSKPSAVVFFEIKRLRLGFNYTVLVKGRNINAAAYDTPHNNQATLNLFLVPPCLPPVNLHVVNVTGSSVLVDWEISTDGPEVLQILVFYRLFDVKMILQPVLSSYPLPKHQRSFNFTGLITQQTYIFSVAAVGYNADYSSSTISAIAQAQTPLNVPPMNLSVLFMNETVFDIAWNAPSFATLPQFWVSPPPVQYKVYVCYQLCMTGSVFPQTARPNDEFVDAWGDLFRWNGLDWVVVLPRVNSYSFVATLDSSIRSFSLNMYNTTALFVRVCAFNDNKELAPSNANCAFLRNITQLGGELSPITTGLPSGCYVHHSILRFRQWFLGRLPRIFRHSVNYNTKSASRHHLCFSGGIIE